MASTETDPDDGASPASVDDLTPATPSASPPGTPSASPSATSSLDRGRPAIGVAWYDATRPPRWLPRALLWVVFAVFAAIAVWTAGAKLQGLFVNILLAFFLALALEPIVLWLVRHGWRRGGAAATALFGSLIAAAVVTALFGNLFVQQLIALARSLPDLYTQVQTVLAERFSITIPDADDLLLSLAERWGEDVANSVIVAGSHLISGIFALTMILLIAYYLLAAGPQFRRVVCQVLTPNRQGELLRFWDITQLKVSDFISSRIVLAALSTAFTWIFLLILDTPYSLPLAVFTGVVSQFVPTIGTYLGGALPVLVALTSQGTTQAIAVLAFIIAYQQVENLIFAPKISARALEMNPAVSLLVVIGFGSLFGPLGAFLALPVAATIQAVANTYIQRHALIDSESLRDPERSAGRQRGLSRRRAANRAKARAAAESVEERLRQGLE